MIATPPPPPPTRADGQPAMMHGYDLLKYLIAHDAPGLLTDDQLELADHAAQDAVSRKKAPDLYYQTITETRHRIACSLRLRAKEKKEQEQESAGTPTAAPTNGRPGKGALLQPRPRIQPPAPAYADEERF